MKLVILLRRSYLIMLSMIELFNLVKQKYTIAQIAKELNIVSGTVSRWNTKQEVPESYRFDLMKLAGIKNI